MFRFLRSWCCAIPIWLTISATPLWASVCTQIFELERLEARVALLSEGLSHSATAPTVTAKLNRIFERAQVLRGTAIRSQDLRQVTDEYLVSLALVRRQMSVRGPVGTADLLATSAHRRLLRRMVLVSHDTCRFERSAIAPSNDGSPGGSRGFSSLPEMSVPVAVSGASVLMASLVGVGYLLHYHLKRRKARRKRYICNYDVYLMIANGQHMRLQMLDVSAMGAKIRRPEDQVFPQTMRLKIGRRKVNARVVWQNPHFVGLLFQRPLSLKFVRKISKGLAERTKRSAGDRNPSNEPEDQKKKGGAFSGTAP